MDVILRQNVQGLGKKGDRVKVADGHARNFLIPKQLAFEATKSNLLKIKRDQALDEIKKSKKLVQAQDLAERIKKVSCTIVKQVSEGERLFGSVTVIEILKCLETEGIFLEKKQVILEQPIKTLGIYPVKIRLAPNIESVLKVWVVK